MGWSIGYDSKWYRDVGYGVPSMCDHPYCNEEINRGLAYVCGGEPYGGEYGCGLFFCEEHLFLSIASPQICERCSIRIDPFDPKPDTQEWINHKLTDESWQQWRDDNPREVAKLQGKEALENMEENNV